MSAGTDHEDLCELTQNRHHSSGFVASHSHFAIAWIFRLLRFCCESDAGAADQAARHMLKKLPVPRGGSAQPPQLRSAATANANSSRLHWNSATRIMHQAALVQPMTKVLNRSMPARDAIVVLQNTSRRSSKSLPGSDRRKCADRIGAGQNSSKRCGQEFRISALGPITHLMQTAQTVGDALASFNRFFESVQTTTCSVLSVSDGTARLVYSIQDPVIRFREQDAGFGRKREQATAGHTSFCLDRIDRLRPGASDHELREQHLKAAAATRSTPSSSPARCRLAADRRGKTVEVACRGRATRAGVTDAISPGRNSAGASAW